MELDKLKKQKKDYDTKMEEIDMLQKEKKVGGCCTGEWFKG